MAKVTGIVEKAYRNPKNGYCSVLVNGNWYSTYDVLYSELEGKMVEFEGVQKGKYFNMKGDPKVLATPAPAAGAVPTVTPDNRQASIVLQSSYKTAAELAVGMLAAGVLPVPTKKADQFDAVLSYVDEIARRLFDNCIDPSEFLNDAEVIHEDDGDPAPKGWNAAEA